MECFWGLSVIYECMLGSKQLYYPWISRQLVVSYHMTGWWFGRRFTVVTVQITHKLNATHMSHSSDMCVCRVCKSKEHAWHQTTRVHAVHTCKIIAPHSYTHLSIWSICYETILLTTSSTLSFIIYACRTILGGIVTDILGIPRHTAFVAPCS